MYYVDCNRHKSLSCLILWWLGTLIVINVIWVFTTENNPKVLTHCDRNKMATTFADDISNAILLNLVPKVPIHNKSLFLVMAWRQIAKKPLHEPMMARFTAHIYVTSLTESKNLGDNIIKPQWTGLYSELRFPGILKSPHYLKLHWDMGMDEWYNIHLNHRLNYLCKPPISHTPPNSLWAQT